MGEGLVGPSVIVHGTPEQRGVLPAPDHLRRGRLLPGLLRARTTAPTWPRWRPGARWTATRSSITGQKVWTSGAARATMMFVLCRTDPAAEKHAGLSYVLIPFTDPGVQYRPIRQMSGAAEFCEDFLDGVRAPLFNVIGGLNNGWRVAMTTLGHERGGRATVQHLRLRAGVLGAGRDGPQVRQDRRPAGPPAAGLGLHRGPADAVQRAAHAGPGWPQGRPPGPEASVAKLFWSEYHKRLGEIAVGIEGTDALIRPEGAGYPTTSWQNVFLSSRAGTIYSGTSEIQRNIIGERALGLPKEPRAWRARQQWSAEPRTRWQPRSWPRRWIGPTTRSGQTVPGSAARQQPARRRRARWSRRSGCASSSRRAASPWSARPTPPAGPGSSPPAPPRGSPAR